MTGVEVVKPVPPWVKEVGLGRLGGPARAGVPISVPIVLLNFFSGMATTSFAVRG
jgi:hypothetical protein